MSSMLVVSLVLSAVSLVLLFGVTSSTDPLANTARKGDDGLYEFYDAKVKRSSDRNSRAINKRDVVG